MKLFNNYKKTNVQYGIYSEIKKPNTIYPNINVNKANNNLMCPAVNSTNNKFFEVNSYLDLDLEIYNNKDNNRLEYKYNYNKNLHPLYTEVHDFIKSMIITGNQNDQYTIQILTPYIFLTDNKNIELTTLDPNLETENLKFINGSFNIYSWARSLNLAYEFIDKNKTAKLNLRINKPILKYYFNFPINLKYVEFDDKQLKFIKSSYNIVKYRKNIKDLYKIHLSRRPNKILQ